MKNHFFFPYQGNKRNECAKLYDILQREDILDKIDTVVEPFGGSAAFSYYLYAVKGHTDKTYVINDIDTNLINLYKLTQNDEKFDVLIGELLEMEKNINKAKYKEILNDETKKLHGYVFKNMIHSIRPGLFPLNYKHIDDGGVDKIRVLKNKPIMNFIKNANVQFLNSSAIRIYEQYKNDSETLIFLDPPYMEKCNAFYEHKKDTEMNIYEYLHHNNIDNEKAYVVSILNDSWIVKLLFKNNIIDENEKTYEFSKTKLKHLTISNF